MSIKCWVYLLGAATMALHASAMLAREGLLREGQPEVLVPATPEAPVDDSRQLVMSFAKAYAEHGEPRIAIFWNRAFSEQLKEIRKTEKVKRKETGGGKTVESQEDGTGGTVEESSVRQTEVTRERLDETVVDTGRREGPEERMTWVLEDAVVRALTASGARVVDRSAAMRFTVGERGADGRTVDALQTETIALLDKSDLLLEILMTNDPNAPSQLLYRVLVKEVGSARMLASAVTDGRPPAQAGKRKLQVGSSGYEPVPEPEPTVGDIARQLSRHVLRTMVAALERR